MRAEKSDFAIYSSSTGTNSIRKSTNIVDLIKRNKKNEKREKVLKIYITVGLGGLIIIFLSVL